MAKGRDVQASAGNTVQELIVTAQKREENIRDVGMSIQAESGDRLNKLGIRDTNDLQKIVPGFQATPTYYGTYVFTIRGVGFQDTSLAGNPTVSVYVDEAPLPFSSMTNGATLDLERVEVLKGPQGTLFGNNATGGAINYIARKPTDHLVAGADVSYGRFNDVDIMGFVSGPLMEGLSARVAVRLNKSDEWQYAYFNRKGDSFGGKDFLNGRVTLQWEPTDWFKGVLTVNAWEDKGWSQNGQLFGKALLSPLAPLAPAIVNYPLAPKNNRAADFMTCVNNSPFNPIQNQELGAVVNSTNPTFPVPPLSQGPGSIVQVGGQPTSCQPARKDNTFVSTALRMEFDLGNDMTLTTLSSAQSFSRIQAIDGSGMAIQDYQNVQHGKIESYFQEVRLSGTFGGKGSWLVGANYEYDETWDQFLQTYNASTASPTVFALNPDGSFAFALALGPTKPTNIQETDTYAAFAHAEYPILDNLIAVGGIRYTEYSKLGGVCGNDGGDGTWAFVAFNLQGFLGSTSPVLSPPGSCASTGPGPTFNSPPNGELFYSRLKEDSISWQAGLNWKFAEDQLAYVNLSKGYKAGSYPTVALATIQQTLPVVQESLMSYEVGTKLLLADRTLQINAAAFYYDYKDKQILGAVSDILFGALPSLVNVPKSRVMGFELSAVYTPDWLEGLTIRPSISYQDSKIQTSGKNTCLPPPAQTNPAVPGFTNCIAGHFYNFDAFNQYADFTGQDFPLAPKWQGSVDAEYRWQLNDAMSAYVGGSVQFVSKTHNFFVNETPIPAFRTPFGGGAPIFVDCNGVDSPVAVGPCPLNHPNDPLTLPSYALVDLRAGVDAGAWTAQAWVRNAANKHYWTSSVHVNDVLLRYTGMPRTYGVTLTYRFE